jgi:hypothetical protein
MAKQVIGIGTVANDGTGDPLRTSFIKTNDNFTELYAGAGGLADDSVTYAKLGTEFTTSIVMPSVTGPLQNLYPGQSIDVAYFYGTTNNSGIEIQFIGGFDPNLAVNQLAGATFTFTGANIGSIVAGSYIIGSNGASFSSGDFYVEIVLNPTQQTDTGDAGGQAQAVTILQAVSSPTVDFSTAQVFTKTLTADATLTFSNTSIGMVKDLVITGNFALTLPAGSTVAGTYDGTVSNLIQVVVTGAGQYWYSISKAI